MKLIIKTLQQSTFKVDIEPDKTVKHLKEQIEKEQGKDYASSAQKLIYSGKILTDETKLADYNIDEKKFIVLMITRPPPAPKPAPVTDKAASTSSTAKTETESKVKTTDDKADSSKITTTTNTNSNTVSTPITTSTTPARTTTRTSTATNPSATTTANNEAPVLPAMSEPQLASRLATLMSQPQLRQIQDLIQQNPHLLSSTIESLAGSEPEMYNFISENPDLFVSALNHPPMGEIHRSSRNTPSDQSQTRSNEQQPPRQQSGLEQLNVSQHDKEAIERLKELGFSEYLAVQAYMACDKDEQLAANLLFQMDQ